MTKKPIPTPERAQIDKFKETAKEVETDNSEETFAKALRQVGKPTRDPKVAGKRIRD